jgi:hypothetical protein
MVCPVFGTSSHVNVREREMKHFNTQSQGSVVGCHRLDRNDPHIALGVVSLSEPQRSPLIARPQPGRW